MDVTTENFEEILKQLETLLPTCDFVSLDMEFSGLTNADPEEMKNEYDNENSLSKDLGEKYSELRTASEFLVIQVGLCPFVWDERRNEFTAFPFNFYTFPREIRGFDRRFLCQASSMMFLVERGHFDFNRLIRSGINSLSMEQEARVRAVIVDSIPAEADDFVRSLRERIANFLASSDTPHLMLPQVDAYRRKLTYQELSVTFKGAVTFERNCSEGGEVSIKISRCKHWNKVLCGTTIQQLRATLENRAKADKEREIWSAVGFRHVVDLLARFEKPLVGHNMLLDLAHLEAAFGRGSLPDSLHGFSTQLRERLSWSRAFFDTKHLASAGPRSLSACFSRSGTALPAVYQTLARLPTFQQPAVSVASGFTSFARNSCGAGGGSGGRAHEAGFDAFMTGLSFLRMAHHIMSKSSTRPTVPDSPPETTARRHARRPAAAVAAAVAAAAVAAGISPVGKDDVELGGGRASAAVVSPVVPPAADLPLTPTRTGLTPRIREISTSSRPYSRMFEVLERYANRVHLMGCPSAQALHLTPTGAVPERASESDGENVDGDHDVDAVDKKASTADTAASWAVPEWDDALNSVAGDGVDKSLDRSPAATTASIAVAAATASPVVCGSSAASVWASSLRTPPAQARPYLENGWPSVRAAGSGSGSGAGSAGGGGGSMSGSGGKGTGTGGGGGGGGASGGPSKTAGGVPAVPPGPRHPPRQRMRDGEALPPHRPQGKLEKRPRVSM